MTSEKAIEITAPQLALRTVDDQELKELLEEWKQTPESELSEDSGGGMILLGPGLSMEEELEP